MKLSVSAYRSQAAAHKKILSGGYHSHHNYGSTEPPSVYENQYSRHNATNLYAPKVGFLPYFGGKMISTAPLNDLCVILQDTYLRIWKNLRTIYEQIQIANLYGDRADE
ncbi:hypothetical protein GQX74_010185 [Glossina fuscipes]|nr:hypothetical protein GQX74_010185 [Glossina fuscipes]